MNKLVKNLAKKAESTIGQAFEFVKEKVTSIFNTNTVTVQQVADYISTHADTRVERKVLLGIPFSFYELDKEGIHYYLEMKGSHILQIDVQTADHMIISYRSYRDSLDTPLKIS